MLHRISPASNHIALKLMYTAIFVMFAYISGCASPPYTGPQPSTQSRMPRTHMSETLRSSIKKVVVLPQSNRADLAVVGSYNNELPSVTDGAIAGAGPGIDVAIADPNSELAKIMVPILILPGALIGASSMKLVHEIQRFRDELTKDLANAASPPLANDALASAVYAYLRQVPDVESNVLAITTPLPEDTDAVLLVKLTEMTIDVQGNDAVITTWVHATLRRLSDGKDLYVNSFQYEDKDTLKNWTKDENALWRNYINFARHYFAREITAEIFEKVELRHILRPIETDSVSAIGDDDWQGSSKSTNPTLAWELTLLGGDSYGAWTRKIDKDNIYYDLAIYDERRLVYSAEHITEPRHDVEIALEGCETFRWSVRPSYHVDGKTKFGEWMRFHSDITLGEGHLGTKASETPAYSRGFALLKTKCDRT